MSSIQTSYLKRSAKYAWLLILSFFSWIEPTSAKLKIDAVLLLDTSASMLTTDPAEKRMDAIRLFLSLLGEEDRIAAIGFDAAPRSLSDFRPLSPAHKAEIARLIHEQGQANGAYTNLRDPVQKALELLENRRPDAVPLAIMLTDGNMDLGDPELDRQYTQELRDTIVPEFAAAGIKLYCLAFSGKSDFAFLESLARPTGGAAWNSEYAEDLKHLFASLFLAVKQPETLSVRGGHFRVDAQVQELTGASEGGKLSLQSPSGKLYTAEEGEDVIKVKNPEAGEWGVKGVENSGMIFVNRDPPSKPVDQAARSAPNRSAPPPSAPPDRMIAGIDLSDPDVKLAMWIMLWGNTALLSGFGIFFLIVRKRARRKNP